MCDPSLLTAGIAIAAAGVIASIAFIVAAIVANNSFFGAPASVGLMLAAAASCLAALVGLYLISNQVNSYFACLNSPEECLGYYTNLRNTVTALITVLSFQAVACGVAAGIAWIPWAGSAPMYVIMATLIIQLPLIASFYAFISDFYYCLEDVQERSTVVEVVGGSIIVSAVAAIIVETIRRRIKATKKEN